MNKNTDFLKSSTERLKEFFTKKESYQVPLYQRSYDWEAEIEVKTLLDDIYNLLKNNQKGKRNKKYYMGNILLKDNNAEKEEYENQYDYDDYSLLKIVDGQQRITTFILIFRALLEIIKIKNIQITPNEKNNLKEYLSFSVYSRNGNDKKIKLKVNIPSNKNVVSIFCSTDNNFNLKDALKEYKDSKYVKNYNFIYNYLNEKISDEEDYYKFRSILNNIYFIVITIEDPFINENIIFKSINGKGKELDLLDLIKNEIFFVIETSKNNSIKKMGDDIYDFFNDEVYKFFEQKSVKHKYFSKKYFLEIFFDTSDYKKSDSNSSTINDLFGKIINDDESINKFEFDCLIREIKNIFRIYKWCLNSVEASKKGILLNNNDFSMNFYFFVEKNFKTYFPLFYHFVKKYIDEEKSSIYKTFFKNGYEFEIIKFFKLLNFYIFNRWLNNLSNGDNKMINSISKKITDFESIKNELNNDLNKINTKTNSKLSINKEDYELLTFIELEAYKKDKDNFNVKYLFAKIENFYNGEFQFKPEDIKKIEIEHIIPQSYKTANLNDIKDSNLKKWNDYFKKNEIEKAEAIGIINKLANLTCVNSIRNKNMSNKFIDDKFEYLKNSNLNINKNLLSNKSWNITDWENRNKFYVEKIIEILDYDNFYKKSKNDYEDFDNSEYHKKNYDQQYDYQNEYDENNNFL